MNFSIKNSDSNDGLYNLSTTFNNLSMETVISYIEFAENAAKNKNINQLISYLINKDKPVDSGVKDKINLLSDDESDDVKTVDGDNDDEYALIESKNTLDQIKNKVVELEHKKINMLKSKSILNKKTRYT